MTTKVDERRARGPIAEYTAAERGV